MHDTKLQVKKVDNSVCTVTGYASVFNKVDCHNDIILPGAFSASVEKYKHNQHPIRLLWQHDPKEPIGVVEALNEDGVGLRIQASINNEIAQGREVVSLVRQGAIDSFSIGFQVEEERFNHSGQREILKANLWEVSVVTFPANSDARIRTIKSDEGQWKQLSMLLSARTIFKL